MTSLRARRCGGSNPGRGKKPFSSSKRPHCLCIASRLRMSGVVPLLSLMPPWRGQGQFKLFTFDLNALFACHANADLNVYGDTFGLFYVPGRAE